jgi:hypothetical protein
MKKKRILVILLIIVGVILALKACGGGSDSDKATVDNTAETTEDYEVAEDEDQSSSDTSDTADTDVDSNADTDADDSIISPDFKKTMDNYEEWFDHYCEVMKKYQDDPSDMALLAETTELLAEEAKIFDEMENMDESEMNTAELAYYLEVTARIEKKLLEVSNY